MGFLQLFVNYVGPTPGVATDGDMNATILNVIGCGNTLAVGSRRFRRRSFADSRALIHN